MEKKRLLSTLDTTEILEVFQALKMTSDDYYFILDFTTDCCYLSKSAVERFNLSSEKLSPVAEGLKCVVVPEDYPLIAGDLEDIIEGRKQFHDLEYRWYDKNMRPIWIHCRGTLIHGQDGRLKMMVGYISELGEKQHVDHLTGLYMEPRLAAEVKKRFANGERAGFLMLLGVDNFKEINEKYGIEAGNKVLRNLAEIIRDSLKPGMKLYRQVADEFAVYRYRDGKREEAEEVYQEIRRRIYKKIEEDDYSNFYTVSAGLLMAPFPSSDYNDLAKYMEFAINEAKRAGKNRMNEFSQEAYDRYIRRLELRKEMRRDIFNQFQGFYLSFQPIVDAVTYEIRGAESLLRWDSRKYGSVPPDEFIPVMEESGLIIPAGYWVMQKAVAFCKRCREVLPWFHTNVNVSYVQLKKSELLEDVGNILRMADVSPDCLMLEITESGYIETDPAFRTAVDEMKASSLMLAIDDFGTGYSNLRYLKDMRTDMIKIDRSFVMRALQSEYDFTLLGHIVEMAHSISLTVCLEGVEKPEEMDKLKELSPDFIQGYLFGRPIPENEFMERYLLR